MESTTNASVVYYQGAVLARNLSKQMRLNTTLQRFLVQAELDALALVISQCDFELGDLLLDLGVAHVLEVRDGTLQPRSSSPTV